MKALHLTAVWNILDAFELSEKYGAKPIPTAEALKLYTGDLVPNIHMKRVRNSNRYGVTFHTELKDANGGTIKNEVSIRVDADLKLSEFFNGCDDAFTMYGEFKIKGWPGAAKMWSKMIAKEYPGCTVTSAVGTVNCLVKRGKK